MGSGGPTKYFAHAVEWNSRRRVVARSTVVVGRDIPECAPADQSIIVLRETLGRSHVSHMYRSVLVYAPLKYWVVHYSNATVIPVDYPSHLNQGPAGPCL